ncbi:VOC family protein [Pedobacter riviphilus]|uniref:VOC family protein n=1 Tax=Pedobacter riviphilus TaxID=2766984 RepID=A0ABX6TMG2_9SPHI|nr:MULTISPECIES: VOC family protein [Pedobacter]NII81629.1 putative 3-demethylubiquinone-9 3-methyltransferase (glyoxalase superfamily) [Pedobacter sp. SG908]NMN35633.1 putative 3-demethylubiquinone-9 3-methyltransferase (glyoxalase superfamily) [Pedobacter sp. SG918]QNR85565.1 VOC family protein [Pedobacter riviphilus]
MAKPLVTCLWFDGQAEAAAKYYCTVFKDSKITQVTPMVVTFELNGNKFMGLNGGPQFKFDEAISLMVNCDNQDEIDYYWDTFINDGGTESVCGWLKDKFGLSWQIVPSNIGELMAEPERAKRVMDAVMQMKKLDMKKMENA